LIRAKGEGKPVKVLVVRLREGCRGELPLKGVREMGGEEPASICTVQVLLTI